MSVLLWLTGDYTYDEDASYEDSERVPYDDQYDDSWQYENNDDDNYYYDEEGRPKRDDVEEEGEYENDAEREALRELLAERAAEEARLALLAYLTSGEPKWTTTVPGDIRVSQPSRCLVEHKSGVPWTYLTSGEPRYRPDEPQYLVDPSAEELALDEDDYNALMSDEALEPDDVYDEEPGELSAPEKRNSFYPYSYEPYGGRWGALVPGTKRGDRDPYDRLYRLAEVLSRPAQLDVDDYDKKWRHRKWRHHRLQPRDRAVRCAWVQLICCCKHFNVSAVVKYSVTSPPTLPTCLAMF